jgi:hypothetical protein
MMARRKGVGYEILFYSKISKNLQKYPKALPSFPEKRGAKFNTIKKQKVTFPFTNAVHGRVISTGSSGKFRRFLTFSLILEI